MNFESMNVHPEDPRRKVAEYAEGKGDGAGHLCIQEGQTSGATEDPIGENPGQQ